MIYFPTWHALLMEALQAALDHPIAETCIIALFVMTPVWFSVLIEDKIKRLIREDKEQQRLSNLEKH